MKRAWWQIVNAEGKYVCRRATLRECRELLDEHVTTPRGLWWNSPAYFIQKVEQRPWLPRARPTEPNRPAQGSDEEK